MTNEKRDQNPNTMNTATARRTALPHGSTIQPITIRRFIALTLLTLALITFIRPPLHAQPALPRQNEVTAGTPLVAPKSDEGGSTSETSAFSIQPSALSSALQPLFDGLLGKYGWLTTALLAIGSLRILFKPVMLVVENALKNDPAKYAAVQKFEAGPVYKVIATVLDLGASIKLPLVKPPPGK